MPFHENYIKLAKNHEGTEDTPFSQNEWMRYYNVPQSIRGGCCMSLAMVWCCVGGSDGIYFPWINKHVSRQEQQKAEAENKETPEGGVNVVIGSQSLYKHARGKEFLSFEAAQEIGRNCGGRSVTEVGKGEKLTADIKSAKIAKIIGTKPGLYQLHYAHDGGHAIGIRHRAVAYKVFDPNGGTVTFEPDEKFDAKKRQNLHNMNHFLFDLIHNLYPKLDGHWLLMRVER